MYVTIEFTSGTAAALPEVEVSPRATAIARRAAASISAPKRVAALVGPPSIGATAKAKSAATASGMSPNDLFLTDAKIRMREADSATPAVNDRHEQGSHVCMTSKRAHTPKIIRRVRVTSSPPRRSCALNARINAGAEIRRFL
jgi:hypothetical protein